jgi:energy-coupling factor transport system ATP-binding protein
VNSIISIKDLVFKYDDLEIFDHFNLEINNKSWTNIIGPNGSGKSTLVKILLGLLPCEGEIVINDTILNNSSLEQIRINVGVVFENPDNQFVSETVADEIAFKLENLGYSKKKIKEHIDAVVEMLNIKHLLKKEPNILSNGEKQLVALASSIINRPKILILDEALTKIDFNTRLKIINILKDLNKSGMTIINITHDMEELVNGDNVLVMNNGEIVLHDDKNIVLMEEKKFNDLGLELPFMASLSIKLKYYNLIENPIFDMNEMVDKLWK